MTKNNPWKFVFKGIISAITYGITLILVPLLLLNFLATYASGYYTPEPEMTFWIIAMGMIVMAFAFGRESSPKRSIRRVIFNAFLTLANMFYIYSFWLSSVAIFDLELPIPLPPLGDLTLGLHLDLTTVIAVELGVIGLKLLILVYDLIDAIVFLSNRNAKIKVSPGDVESDTFATYLEDGGQ